MRIPVYWFVLTAALLVSCSSGSSTAKKEEKAAPQPPVTARYAYHQAYLSARTWAQDLEILRVRSMAIEGMKAEPGQAPVWEITFVSPSKMKQRAYSYSVVETPSIHQGAFGGLESEWRGRDGQATSFNQAAFKVDSPDAWKTASEKSKEYMAKFPDKPITFLMEKTPRHPDPTWRVIWGTSASTSDYSIYVDAVTGEYLERMR